MEHSSTSGPLGINLSSTQYQLDNDIDFHNSAEPSTTSCPLLPGQLVNVLQVPFHLSNGRPRNASVSSTSSDLRTMDPQDKYLHPRPAPTPTLSRLNTSSAALFSSQSANSSPVTAIARSPRSVSASRDQWQLPRPSKGTALRKFRLPHKLSVDGIVRQHSCPSSPVGKPSGFMAAIRQLASSRSTSPEPDALRGRSSQRQHEDGIIARPEPTGVAATAGMTSSRSSSRDHSRIPIPESPVAQLPVKPLAFRQGLQEPGTLDDSLSVSSFQHQRRQRSRQRSRSRPSSLRNSPLFMDETVVGVSGTLSMRREPLETLTELKTPTWPLAAVQEPCREECDVVAESPIEKDKRLPTLPNTPSSAYPPSLAPVSPTRPLSQEIDEMQSHFSTATITTIASDYDVISGQRSHFSEWSTAGLAPSPAFSGTSSLASDASPLSNQVSLDHSVPSSPNVASVPLTLIPGFDPQDNSVSAKAQLPNAISSSTISSCDSTIAMPSSYEGPGLGIGNTDREAVYHKRSGSCTGFKGYKLPDELQASETSLKQCEPFHPQGPFALSLDQVSFRRPGPLDQMPADDFSDSTTMQQLMDELSYLGGMIQR